MPLSFAPTRAIILIAPIVAGLSCVSCSKPEESAIAKKAPTPIEVKEYQLKGEVEGIHKATREMVIRHEDVPGFMPAMTMPFVLPKDTDWDEFRLGDRVEGRLRVESQKGVTSDYQLLDLTVTKPALKSATLTTREGATSLEEAPERLKVGDEVPDFAFTDQDGAPRKLTDYRGFATAITFIYTRCPLPEFCPAMDRRFADLARALSSSPVRAAKVRLLSISFDPGHDTPAVLREHARIRGGQPPLWTFAVATGEELARVAPRLGLAFGPGKNEILHNLCTAVIGPDGRLVRLEVGTKDNDWSTADMLRTIADAAPVGR